MGLSQDTWNCGLRMRQKCRERLPHNRLQRKPLGSDPDMHRGMCVAHVPWCISGSLTRDGQENVPGIPGSCTTRNFRCLARGPFWLSNRSFENPEGQKYSIACNRYHYRAQNAVWQTANALEQQYWYGAYRCVTITISYPLVTDDDLQWNRRICLLYLFYVVTICINIEANTKLATLLQVTFPKSLSGMKLSYNADLFWFKVHLNLLRRAQITISQHCII